MFGPLVCTQIKTYLALVYNLSKVFDMETENLKFEIHLNSCWPSHGTATISLRESV